MKHIKKYKQARIFVTVIYPTVHDSNFDPTQIKMHVIPSSVTRNGVGLKLVNYTDYEAMYGEYYRLERYVRGQWRAVGLHMSVISIGYGLPPNSYSDEINRTFWLSSSLRRRLSNGRYRIIKDVRLSSGPTEIIQAAAEFTIQRSAPN